MYRFAVEGLGHTQRPLSSSFLGLAYRILNRNHKKELLRSLRVGFEGSGFSVKASSWRVFFGSGLFRMTTSELPTPGLGLKWVSGL